MKYIFGVYFCKFNIIISLVALDYLAKLSYVCYLLGALTEEIEHYWGAILDRSFSEGAANNTTSAVAAAEAGAPDGDVDEGLPGRILLMS